VRGALESLPGVEKESVKVNKDQKLAMFKVKEPTTFAVEDAVKKINDLGGSYKANVMKTGKAVGARPTGEPEKKDEPEKRDLPPGESLPVKSPMK
jgi:hypothetical protein